MKQTMNEQLDKIASQVPKAVKLFNPFLPALNNIGEDGRDHINVWEHGVTNLGKALNHLADMPFVHSTYGKFKSMEGFWYYITSVKIDDNLRRLSGYKARKYGESLESKRIENFRKIIADANWQKIKSYPGLMAELKELDLALDSYFIIPKKNKTDEDIRSRPASASWIVPGIHEIRLALQQNREPNFDFLNDNPKSNNSKISFKSNLRDIYSAPVPAKQKKVLKDLAKFGRSLTSPVELDGVLNGKTVSQHVSNNQKEIDEALNNPKIFFPNLKLVNSNNQPVDSLVPKIVTELFDLSTESNILSQAVAGKSFILSVTTGPKDGLTSLGVHTDVEQTTSPSDTDKN